jgi:hypothetical protein
LQVYVEGHASPDERRDMRAHLEGCGDCRDLVLALALIDPPLVRASS